MTFADRTVAAVSHDGLVWTYAAFPRPHVRVSPPSKVVVDRKSRRISWQASPERGVTYRVLRNTRSARDYETVAEGVTGTSCVDPSVDFAAEDYVTYKVVAVTADGVVSPGALHTCSRAKPIEKERYILQSRELSLVEVLPDDID